MNAIKQPLKLFVQLLSQLSQEAAMEELKSKIIELLDYKDEKALILVYELLKRI